MGFPWPRRTDVHLQRGFRTGQSLPVGLQAPCSCLPYCSLQQDLSWGGFVPLRQRPADCTMAYPQSSEGQRVSLLVYVAVAGYCSAVVLQ